MPLHAEYEKAVSSGLNGSEEQSREVTAGFWSGTGRRRRPSEAAHASYGAVETGSIPGKL
jgi:hypothetical protein